MELPLPKRLLCSTYQGGKKVENNLLNENGKKLKTCAMVKPPSTYRKAKISTTPNGAFLYYGTSPSPASVNFPPTVALFFTVDVFSLPGRRDKGVLGGCHKKRPAEISLPAFCRLIRRIRQ